MRGQGSALATPNEMILVSFHWNNVALFEVHDENIVVIFTCLSILLFSSRYIVWTSRTK